MQRFLTLLLAFALASLGALCSGGPARADGEVTIDTLLRGLNNPCGVAVRPGGTAATGYEVFVSDSGAGRIVKVKSNKPGSSTAVVTDFPTRGRAADPIEVFGPRGLLFLNPGTLLVACYGGDKQDSLRLFALPTEEGSVRADAAKRTIVVLSPDGEIVGPVRIYALARTQINDFVSDEIVVTGDEGNTGGWIGKASWRPDAPGDLGPFVPTAERLSVKSPAGIAVGGKGYMVVGQIGPREDPRAVLVFYNPIDGVPVLRLKTKLRFISGLAYSQVTGNLYATDYSPDDAQQGGVFRIDDAGRPGEAACQAVRIATIQRPTALAFGPDSALWVTACGPEAGQGVLVRLTKSDGAL